MPLVIRRVGVGDAPTIICDHCGEVIATAREGNYQYKMTAEGKTDQQIYFTHKDCCHPFEAANGWGGRWGAMELSCLPLYLVNNLKIDWEAAKKTVSVLASL